MISMALTVRYYVVVVVVVVVVVAAAAAAVRDMILYAAVFYFSIQMIYVSHICRTYMPTLLISRFTLSLFNIVK